MAVQLLMEHDSFAKARRALIITSVILIILTQVDFRSDMIEVFKLELGVNPRQIIIWNMIAVFYFIYLLAIEFPGYVRDYTYNQRHQVLSDIEARIKKIAFTFFGSSPNIDAMNQVEMDVRTSIKHILTLTREEIAKKMRIGEKVPAVTGSDNEDIMIRALAHDFLDDIRTTMESDMTGLFNASVKQNRFHILLHDVLPMIVFAAAALIMGLKSI